MIPPTDTPQTDQQRALMLVKEIESFERRGHTESEWQHYVPQMIASTLAVVRAEQAAIDAARIAELEARAKDAEQQVLVLRPGGMYAWKTKAEAAEARIEELEKELAEARRGR